MSFPEPQYKEEELPRGWEELRDLRSGKVMYIDHINKATTWIDPRDSYARARNDSEELPFGMTEEWDARAGSYFMNNLTRRATMDDPRTGQPVAHDAHAHARSRTMTAEDLMRAKTPRGTRGQAYPRDESPAPSHTSLGTYSMGNLSHDLDGHSTGTRSHNTSDDMTAGGMSPVLDDEESNLRWAKQLQRDYEKERSNVIEPLVQDVVTLAEKCGIYFGMPALEAARAIEPVSAARKATQGKLSAELRQYKKTADEVNKQMRTGLRAIEAGNFQGDIPRPPSFAQPIATYVQQLRGHVEEQQNDLHDLRALMVELPDHQNATPSAGVDVVQRLGERQEPMVVAMLRSLMRRQDGRSSRIIEEAQNQGFFDDVIQALEASIEYKTLTEQLQSFYGRMDRATKSSTPNLELSAIVGMKGTSSF